MKTALLKRFPLQLIQILETVRRTLILIFTSSPSTWLCFLDSDFVCGEEVASAQQEANNAICRSPSESDFAYFSGEEIENILDTRQVEKRVEALPSIKAFMSLQELLHHTEDSCEQASVMDRNSLSSNEGQNFVMLARQRQENSKASLNFYDQEPRRGFKPEPTTENFNSSYSTDPYRSVPDLLFNDYINISVT